MRFDLAWRGVAPLLRFVGIAFVHRSYYTLTSAAAVASKPLQRPLH